jgi:crossover junction endodeoxyribonuclease RuvC
MLIMGIDPGIGISGYGFIESENNVVNLVDYGVLRTNTKTIVPERLKQIYNGYLGLIEKYKPDVIAVEELFFNKNAKTIITVGEARGVALLAAALLNIEVVEYTPLQVKQSVVGYGRASKLQVQQMVKLLLGMDTLPKPDDAADALAVALCFSSSNKIERLINQRG